MYFKQFTHDSTGCISYLVGCLSKSCTAVIDPQRDIQAYVETATNKGMEITHVIETHVHADHLSGARKLAEVTGARLYHHEASPVKFRHERLREGDELELGNAHIQIIHTPGHTPESVSLLVQDRSRAPEPHFVIPFSWAAPAGRISSGRRASPIWPSSSMKASSASYCVLRTTSRYTRPTSRVRPAGWGSAPNPCPPSASRRGSTRSCLPATGRSLCDWSPRTCPPSRTTGNTR